MSPTKEEVSQYYDENVQGKLEDFVEGNPRVERAWHTVESWVPGKPKRILEVGCGIGNICWRLNQRWPETEIIGLDPSSESIRIARQLFGAPGVMFIEGLLDPALIPGRFDAIVLMDVYEHISIEDRPSFHAALRDLLADDGVVILSFPTVRHQDYLRREVPNGLQPVDENIDLPTVLKLAQDAGTRVVFYQEMNVWHQGDYGHAVLDRRDEWRWVDPPRRGMPRRKRIRLRLKRLLGRSRPVTRADRFALVEQKLGMQFYRK